MADLIKEIKENTSEELLQGLIGKFVHVPNNPHKIKTATEADGTVNAWFAGKVAGYEKAFVGFNYEEGEFYEAPKVFFQLLLCDGMGYVLSDGAEMYEITEEEFLGLVAEQDAKNIREELVHSPNKDIIKPSKDIIVPSNVINLDL